MLGAFVLIPKAVTACVLKMSRGSQHSASGGGGTAGAGASVRAQRDGDCGWNGVQQEAELLLPLSGVLAVSEEGSGLVRLHLPQGKGSVTPGAQGANGLQTENWMGRTLPPWGGGDRPRQRAPSRVRGSPPRLTPPALPPTPPLSSASDLLTHKHVLLAVWCFRTRARLWKKQPECWQRLLSPPKRSCSRVVP